MKKRRALAATAGAIVLLGLAACAHRMHGFGPEATCDQHQRRFCSGNHCDLDITVSACSPAGITVAENDLHLCKRDGPKTITWKLRPGGEYRFRDDGIDFKRLPDTVDFDPATKQQGPFRYSWTDKLGNGGGRSFEYAIRLEHSSGQRCDKDPRITND
jgi:hypothetical protein